MDDERGHITRQSPDRVQKFEHSFPLDIWMEVSRHLPTQDIKRLRLVSKSLLRATDQQFGKRHFFRTAHKPTLAGLTKLVSILAHPNYGVYVDTIILRYVPDDMRFMGSVDYPRAFEHRLKEVFELLKQNGKNVEWEVTESAAISTQLNLDSRGLCNFLLDKASATGYEIKTFKVTNWYRHRPDMERDLWKQARINASTRDTSYETDGDVHYVAKHKTLRLEQFDVGSPMSPAVLNELESFAISRLQILGSLISSTEEFMALVVSNHDTLCSIELQDVTVSRKNYFIHGVGDPIAFWGELFQAMSELPNLRQIRVSDLFYHHDSADGAIPMGRSSWDASETFFDRVMLPGGLTTLEIRGENFVDQIKDLAAFVMANDEAMRKKWLNTHHG